MLCFLIFKNTSETKVQLLLNDLFVLLFSMVIFQFFHVFLFSLIMDNWSKNERNLHKPYIKLLGKSIQLGGVFREISINRKIKAVFKN